MAASQQRLIPNRSCEPALYPHGLARPRSSQSARSSSSSLWQQQQQGGWLCQAVSRPYHPSHQQHQQPLQHAAHDQQWSPQIPAAQQQQHLHELVYREQGAALQQQHHHHNHQASTGPRRPGVRQPDPQGSSNKGSSSGSSSSKGNPSWQWLASQLELNPKAGTVDKLLDYLMRLVQPGLGPSAADRQQAHYCNFISRLLGLLQQRLEEALPPPPQQQQQQQHHHPQQQPAVRLGQVSKILWCLGKLQLAPNWALLEQQRQQYRHAAPFGQQQLLQLQVSQRSAAAITAAMHLLQLHLQLAVQEQQQQGQEQGVLPSKQLSQSIWGVVKLQYPVSNDFLQLYLQATQQALPQCSCRDLSTIAWALVQLKCRPGQQWAAAYFSAAAAAIASSSNSGGGQAAAAVLLSAADLGLKPGAAWLQPVLGALTGEQQGAHDNQQQQQQQGRAGPLLQQMDARSLASLLGALAKWEVVPSPAVFQQLQLAALQQLHSCNGLDTAQLLWALATITAAAPGVALASSSSGSSRGRGRRGGGSFAAAELQGQRQQQQHEGLQEQQGQEQQQQQQGQEPCLLVVLPGLLEGLTNRLAETVGHTPPQQVVLGMWATAKLHALTRPSPLQQQQQQQQAGEPSPQELQQEQQHWQLCRRVLLHCLSQLCSAGSMGELSAHSLAVLAWGLVLAGAVTPDHLNALEQQQQQQQQQLVPTQLPSRGAVSPSSSSSSSSKYVGLILPSESLWQLLAASRLSLDSASPHSQALLLSALVHMGAKPSWQWLLGFWEASEPLLNRCSAQDLSMMAEGLVRLRAKPLASWLGRFLEASQGLAERAGAAASQQLQQQQLQQGQEHRQAAAAAATQVLPAGCLTAVLGALASPAWGMLPEEGPSDSSSSSSISGVQLPEEWTAAMQAHVLLLLPQLQLSEVALLLRAAAKLGWSSSSSSSSAAGRTDGWSVVSGLLQAAVASPQLSLLCEAASAGAGPAGAGSAAAVGLLQCMSAALQLQLPAGAEQQQQQQQQQEQWWLQATHRLQQVLQRQQQGLGLSHRQLHAGMHTMSSALQALPAAAGADGSSSSSTGGAVQQSLMACLQLLAAAAVDSASDCSTQELLLFLNEAWDCLQLLSTTYSSSSSRDLLACTDALQQLQAAAVAALLQLLPSASLCDFAAAVFTLSQCGHMSHGAGAAAAAAGGTRPAGSNGSSTSSKQALAAALDVLEEQLLQLEGVMLQEEQLLLRLQQQQQQQQQRGLLGPTAATTRTLSSTSSSSEAPALCSVAAQDAAPHLVRLLVAFAQCSYRPPARLLRQVLRVIEVGMPALTPRQLSLLADAASALQLGSVASPGFTQTLWEALGEVLQPPEQLQQRLNSLYLLQEQQQQQGEDEEAGSVSMGLAAVRVAGGAHQLQRGAAVAAAAVLTATGTSAAPAAASPAAAGAAAAGAAAAGTAVLVRPDSSSSSSRRLGNGLRHAGASHHPGSVRSSSGHGTAIRSSTSSKQVGHLLGSRVHAGALDQGRSFSRVPHSSSSSSSGSSSSSSSSRLATEYGVSVLLAVKAINALCTATHPAAPNGSSSRSSSAHGSSGSDDSSTGVRPCDGMRYAAACSRSCRAAVGQQLPQSLAAAALNATACVVQHLLQPGLLPRSQALAPQTADPQRHQQQLERQQQERRQQQHAVVVPLLRLLAPVGCRVSSTQLRAFTSRVGPLLGQLQGRDKARAWRALHGLLQAYRAGQQAQRVAQQMRRRRQQQQQQQQRLHRRVLQRHATGAAAAAVGGTPLADGTQQQHQAQQTAEPAAAGLLAVAAAASGGGTCSSPVFAAVATAPAAASHSTCSSSSSGTAHADLLGAHSGLHGNGASSSSSSSAVGGSNGSTGSVGGSVIPAGLLAGPQAEAAEELCEGAAAAHEAQLRQQQQQQQWLHAQQQLLPRLPARSRQQRQQATVVPC